MFDREDGDELPPGVNQLVRVYVAQKRKISDGDKLAGRHGNKGVIAKILPVEDMPFMEDGTRSTSSSTRSASRRRMNIGQILELHLGLAGQAGAGTRPGEPPEAAADRDRCRQGRPPGTIGEPGVRRCPRGRDHRPARSTLPTRDGADVDATGKAEPVRRSLRRAVPETRSRWATCTS